MVERESTISSRALTVTPIFYPRGDHATGHFYIDGNGTTFLVTNEHVVDVHTLNGKPLKSFKIYTRNKGDLTDLTPHEITLRDDEGNPLWISHSDEEVDVAFLPLEPPLTEDEIHATPIVENEATEGQEPNTASQAFNVDCTVFGNLEGNLGVHTGTQVMSMGYPFRIEAPYFPVVRDGLISTPYQLSPSEHGHSFLIDSRIHEGMSGSPVITVPSAMNYHIDKGWQLGGKAWLYLGVLSREEIGDMGFINPSTKPLDLNKVYSVTTFSDLRI